MHDPFRLIFGPGLVYCLAAWVMWKRNDLPKDDFAGRRRSKNSAVALLIFGTVLFMICISN